MSYLFEILPSLLSGASMTLQVFALVLIFSIPLGVLIAFALQVLTVLKDIAPSAQPHPASFPWFSQ
ncbi:MAG: hypothetical protein E6087_02635, partial [Streptococcus mitis]|nr:hypothetical protein [Streptococcus mitis]